MADAQDNKSQWESNLVLGILNHFSVFFYGLHNGLDYH